MNSPKANTKLAYLKRTGDSGEYRYWYWHYKLQTIVGHPKPEKSLIASRPCYTRHPYEKGRECQVGDLVMHFPSMRFAVLYGHDRGLWHAEARLGGIFCCRESSLKLVSDNLIWSHTEKAEHNLVGAKTRDELNFAERLGEIEATDYIERALPHIPVEEATLLRLHRLTFQQLYEWAGKYRDEEIVVGIHNSPTLEADAIPVKVKDFFKNSAILRQAGRSKTCLLEALLEFHTELAWIHPFMDGNGRIIRIMCSLIAFEWGHKLIWDVEKGKKRRQYHKAVRYAVHKNKRNYLRMIIARSLQ